MTDPEPEAAVDPTDQPAPQTRYGVAVSQSRGQVVIHPPPDRWIEVATAAREDGFDQLIDLTAVDYLAYGAPRDLPPGVPAQRFEVVASLLGHERRERIRLRAQVPGDQPCLPSLFDLWPGVEALEREVFDMFGISFTDHPDLTRILMPEDWEGHPLRKDYGTGSIPVQFKAAPNVR
jgi:NADH-quinone oxidoreductase subunit C